MNSSTNGTNGHAPAGLDLTPFELERIGGRRPGHGPVNTEAPPNAMAHSHSIPAEKPRPAQEPAGARPEAIHSEDFRSVNWFGTLYSFTPGQAGAVRLLWEAWEKGLPEVHRDALIRAANSNSTRLVDVFRGNPAWGSLIVRGKRQGTYRLPESPSNGYAYAPSTREPAPDLEGLALEVRRLRRLLRRVAGKTTSTVFHITIHGLNVGGLEHASPALRALPREPFVPNPLQQALLKALDGKALKTDALARAAKTDRRRLYKPGGVNELKELGKVALHSRLGYYRPDAPPPQLGPDVDQRAAQTRGEAAP